ncbi:MAG TPA: ACP S-malonyltransferase [Peptococcaceae bacterium]|nr:ACP S-malonyltransferase [Peptococcaceae bacterium]
MVKTAFVFAGQGAQYSGMGRDLYEGSAAAKAVFDQAEALRPGIIAQCFEGTPAELADTANTQPCLFCVDLAAAYTLQASGIQPNWVAGFSLGEIAALTFAGVFDFAEGFRFVCQRAALMKAASEKNPSAMLAVLKLSGSQVEDVCRAFEAAYPVNYNSQEQTVVAISKEKQPEFSQAIQAAGGKALLLPVSGGFHSPFMNEVHAGLVQALEPLQLKEPVMPVYSNLNAEPYGQRIKETIADQVNHPVYWQRSIEAMTAAGTKIFVEVGAGKTLTGLIRKIVPEAKALNVEDMQGVTAVQALFDNDSK